MAKKKNTGHQYERLTQRVLQAILEQQGISTVKVEHDVRVQGRTTSHQIDVFWRFKHGPIEHTVVVQCKDEVSRVKQLEMLAFKQILDDIPGQPRGIFVTRTGFQRGAIAVGRANGIGMKLLREPTDEDWRGRIRNISVDVRIFAPEFRRFRLLADETWYQEQRARRGFPAPGETFSVDTRHDGLSLVFVNEEGRVVTNANEVANGIVKGRAFEEHDWELRRHEFVEPLFYQTGIEKFPRLRMLGVEVEVMVKATTMDKCIEIRGDEIVAFILHDVVDGTRWTFADDLQLVGEDETTEDP